jgi:hypothetical protein
VFARCGEGVGEPAWRFRRLVGHRYEISYSSSLL